MVYLLVCLFWMPSVSDESLISLVREGDVEAVSKAFDETQPSDDLNELLVEAVRLGSDTMALKLLALGASASATDASNTSVLMWSVLLDRDSLRTKLLQSGADLEYRDHAGRNVIMVAAMVGDQEAFNALNAAGAALDGRDSQGRGLLHYTRFLDEVQIDDLKAKGAHGSLPGNAEHHVKLAFYEGLGAGNIKQPTAKPIKGRIYKDPLLVEAWSGTTPLKQIPDGSDLNARGIHDETALHLLAERGDVEGIAFLIKQGVSVDAVDQDGWTPLQTAAAFGHWQVLKKLHQAGAKLDHQAADGSTSLMWAARGNHQLAVKYLLGQGATANLKDQKERTALNYVARLKQKDMYKLLRLLNVPIGKPGVYGPDDDGSEYRRDRLRLAHEFAASQPAQAELRGMPVSSLSEAETLQPIADAIDDRQWQVAEQALSNLPPEIADTEGAKELWLEVHGNGRDFDKAFEAYQNLRINQSKYDVLLGRTKQLIANIYGRVSDENHLQQTLSLVWDAYGLSRGQWRDAFFYAGHLESRLRRFELALASFRHYQSLVDPDDFNAFDVSAAIRDLEIRKAYKNGKPLEKLAIKGSDGNQLDFRNWRDKGLLMDIRSVSCRPCQASLPFLRRLAKYRKTRQFDLITVFVDRDPQVVADYVAKQKIDWIWYHDSDAQITRPVFDVRDYPTIVLLNGNLEIVSNNPGWGENFWNVLRQQILDETP